MPSMFDMMRSNVGGQAANTAAQQQAGNMMQLQQAAKQAPETANAAQVSQAGANMASQQAKQNLQNLSNVANEQQNINAQQKQALAQQLQQKLSDRDLAQRQQLQVDSDKLAKLDNELAARVMSERNKLIVDSAGLKYMNQKQLLDLKASQAKSTQELADYQQKVEQTFKRKQLVMQTAYNKLTQLLNNDAMQASMNLSIDQKKYLAQVQRDAQQKMAKMQKQAAEINGQHQLLTSVGSAILGAAFVAGTGGVGAGVLAAGAGGAAALGVGTLKPGKIF